MGYLLEQFNKTKVLTPLSPQQTDSLGRKKPPLQTSQGLLNLAEQKGFQDAAAKLKQTGEQPERIFSGGPIMDLLDGLNALQYGVTGLLQGKSFMEGVKTRASFTKEEGLKNKGLAGTITGIAMDIAVDPLTYLGGLGILKRGITALRKLKTVGKVTEVAASSKVGKFLGEKLIYRFGQDPIYKNLAERTIKNINVGTQNLLDLARPLTTLNAKTQKLIADARKAGKLENLPRELLAKAKPAFDELDKLGNEAVKVGLLKKETYQENVGKYIARLYRKFEAPVKEGVEKIKTKFDVKPLRVDLSRFMKRKDIPEDVRNAMGEILEAGYPTAKAMVQINQAIERTKFFQEVATKWGKNIAEEGLIKLPDTSRLGALANKYVPKPIFDDIQEIIRPRDPTITKRLVAGFKFGKVILNPATHARNIGSNFILNSFEGLSPYRLDIYGRAAKELATKGKMYQEARLAGLGMDTFAAREIKDMLVGPNNANFVKRFGRQAIDKISDLYQKEEEFAKLAQFIYQRGKGLSPDDAMKIAERATFNYSQVTPFIRKLRESVFGYPFITFTYKATPQVARILVTKPGKISIYGKIRNAIENTVNQKELAEERAAEPDYIRNGLFVRLPNKDKFGRSGYFDLTYIVPLGDLFSGQFIEQEKEGEKLQQTFLRKLPFFNIISDLAQNKDFFGNPIVKGTSLEPEQQGADIMKYLLKSYGPPLMLDFPVRLQRSLEFELSKEEEPLEKQKRTTRTIQQELLRGLAGVKITPFNLDRERQKRERELQERLKTFLEAEGVIRRFEIPFIPKEEKPQPPNLLRR